MYAFKQKAYAINKTPATMNPRLEPTSQSSLPNSEFRGHTLPYGGPDPTRKFPRFFFAFSFTRPSQPTTAWILSTSESPKRNHSVSCDSDQIRGYSVPNGVVLQLGRWFHGSSVDRFLGRNRCRSEFCPFQMASWLKAAEGVDLVASLIFHFSFSFWILFPSISFPCAFWFNVWFRSDLQLVCD